MEGCNDTEKDDNFIFESKNDIVKTLKTSYNISDKFIEHIDNLFNSDLELENLTKDPILKLFLGKGQGVFNILEKTIRLIQKIKDLSEELTIPLVREEKGLTDAEKKDAKILKKILFTSHIFKEYIKEDDKDMYLNVFEEETLPEELIHLKELTTVERFEIYREALEIKENEEELKKQKINQEFFDEFPP